VQRENKKIHLNKIEKIPEYSALRVAHSSTVLCHSNISKENHLPRHDVINKLCNVAITARRKDNNVDHYMLLLLKERSNCYTFSCLLRLDWIFMLRKMGRILLMKTATKESNPL
jgi:hypothetical protein